MPSDTIATIKRAIDRDSLQDESAVLTRLIDETGLDDAARARVSAQGADLVRRIRKSARPGLMEVFLAEYGLSTEEGIALMCLAEALLRVPDAPTMDALIEDKIAPSDWGRHMGHSSSSLVNASTWALMLTGKVLEEREPGVAGHLRAAVKRLGEPVIRSAVGRAMREMGRQFVLGENITSAMKRAATMERAGFTYSYDMLGEAARTMPDARRYHEAYANAIETIARARVSDDAKRNPGISVKLSALHPRYEVAQRERVMEELVPRLRVLARMARDHGLGFNIDAEEADRLALSLDVVEAVLEDPELHGWDGFGLVVQAYGQRSAQVIDWLHATAERLDRRFTLRLVKGAYWDTEIKRAQVLGLDGFPVFTHKPASDVCFIANARRLLGMTERIYPQFATHNAHSVAAILEIADELGAPKSAFEFQRLHGMGERLHDIVMADHGTRCRIYAPVGAHRDLLAYLVRRLLENGANSSFVNQLVDEDVAPETIAACPIAAARALPQGSNPLVTRGPDLFRPERANSRGWDLTDQRDLDEIEAARAPHRHAQFEAGPIIAGNPRGAITRDVINPATPDDTVGRVTEASADDVAAAIDAAQPWAVSAAERRAVLDRVADLYEREFGRLFAIVAREAGKTQLDAVGELREAVDFLRYYGAKAEAGAPEPRGVFACISPWNFPLAIFTGQIAGALAAGNAVLAKPAEQTPLIAAAAVQLMHEAGVPREALQLLPGDGATVGAALTSDPRIDGVAFTGGTDTAQAIRRSMAEHLDPAAPLIAETGGLNAMVVDSTALHEQAVRDVLASAFQSAGQRCSALRCLYVQEDVAPQFREMLFGAMDELRMGDPWALSTDVGPVIDAAAAQGIHAHIEAARNEGRVLKEMSAPDSGHFVAPTVIAVDSITQLEREVFGPVLHLATYKAHQLDAVIDAVNGRGYGLTFGMHTRIDDRVQQAVERIRVGNTYVNRNQIGAVVGSQPFGGEGLSGTGPKAGGPRYVPRFAAPERPAPADEWTGAVDTRALQGALDGAAIPHEALRSDDLPGPTGESNRLSLFARSPLLCLGPGPATARAQAKAVQALGGVAVMADGALPAEALHTLRGFSGVVWWGDAATGRELARALAARAGPILPLIMQAPDEGHVVHERHVCVDTTASGGNAQLLAAVSA